MRHDQLRNFVAIHPEMEAKVVEMEELEHLLIVGQCTGTAP